MEKNPVKSIAPFCISNKNVPMLASISGIEIEFVQEIEVQEIEIRDIEIREIGFGILICNQINNWN